jgi:hypothetical protein
MRVLHVRGINEHDSRMNQKYSRVDLSGCDIVFSLHDAERFLESGEYEGVYIEGLSISPRSGYSIESGLAVARKVKEMGLPLVVMDVALSDEDAETARNIADCAITETGRLDELRKALKQVLGMSTND